MTDTRPHSSIIQRRQWLRTLGRATGLASLAGVGLLANRTTNDSDNPARANDHPCINRQLCCSCNAFKTCNLPAALSAKQTQRKP